MFGFMERAEETEKVRTTLLYCVRHISHCYNMFPIPQYPYSNIRLILIKLDRFLSDENVKRMMSRFMDSDPQDEVRKRGCRLKERR